MDTKHTTGSTTVKILQAVKQFREECDDLIGPTYADLQQIVGGSRQNCANHVWACIKDGLLDGILENGMLVSRSIHLTPKGETYLERVTGVLDGGL